MNWDVRWTEDATAELQRLDRRDPKLVDRIRRRVNLFAQTGAGDVRKLTGRQDEWRLRVGAWRVIFTFDRDTHTLIVLLVDRRKDVYRG